MEEKNGERENRDAGKPPACAPRLRFSASGVRQRLLSPAANVTRRGRACPLHLGAFGRGFCFYTWTRVATVVSAVECLICGIPILLHTECAEMHVSPTLPPCTLLPCGIQYDTR